jgi:hypothetical protein
MRVSQSKELNMPSNPSGLRSSKRIPVLLATASFGALIVATTSAEARIGVGRPGVGVGHVGSGLGVRPGAGVGRLAVRGWHGGVGYGRYGYGGRVGYGAAALAGAAVGYGAANSYGYGNEYPQGYGYTGLYNYAPASNYGGVAGGGWGPSWWGYGYNALGYPNGGGYPGGTGGGY